MSETKIIPEHLGFVLDGNRRWAKQRGLSAMAGHKRGADVLQEIAAAAFKRGVKYVSAYVFSTENWQRTEQEVSFLMGLVVKVARQYMQELQAQDIRVIVLGDREGINRDVLRVIEKVESETADNKSHTLAFCFNYGGRSELVNAVRSIVHGGISAEEITDSTIREHLYYPDLPDLDLMVRTSGEQRTSGYMLYRSDYAELYFEEKLWPNYTEKELDKALDSYAHRKRRFGR